MGDKIEAGVGDSAKGAVVGKDNTQTANENIVNVTIEPPSLPPPPPPGHFAPSHPIRQYTLADVVAALIGDPGDPLTGRAGAPGLVSQLTAMVARLESIDKRQIEAHGERIKLLDDLREVKTNQHPYALQILMLVMAVAIFVVLLIFVILLIRSRS